MRGSLCARASREAQVAARPVWAGSWECARSVVSSTTAATAAASHPPALPHPLFRTTMEVPTVCCFNNVQTVSASH